MKFIFIFITAAMLQASAASYGQNINLHLKNTSLEEVFSQLRKQSGYNFLYNTEMLSEAKAVNLNARNKPLKEVLDACFQNQPLTYIINQNNVVVKRRPVPVAVENDQKNVTVTGLVTDDKGEPLPGVSVKLKGTTTGTVTNNKGSFELSVDNTVANQGTLVFSYLGFATQEVPISGKTTINIKLSNSQQSLNEVIVVAYGTTTKRDLTGSVASINSGDIAKTVSSTPQQALQGRMAGVQVVSAGGDPNSKPIVRVRGVTTFSGQNADPLYVVDGVVIDEYGSRSTFSVSQQKATDIQGTQNIFNLINPDDIESISVLKDASSAAAYGARAANGVVLITTKRGKEGKAKVTLNAQYGISNLPKTLDVLNTQQYVAMQNEAHAGDPGFTSPVYDVFKASSPSYLGNSPTYDWQKEIKNKNAPYQDYNLSVSGGNATSNYYVGGGYGYQESDLKFNKQNRYTLSVRTEFKPNKYIEFGQTLRLAYTNLNDLRGSTGIQADLYHVRRATPFQPIYDPKGYMGFASALPNTYGGAVSENFFAIPSVESQNFGTIKTLGNAYLTFTPIKDLHITGTVGGDYTTLRRLTLVQDSVALFNTNGSSTGNSIEDLNSVNFSLIKRINATYAIRAGKHSIDLYAHAEEQDVKYHSSIAAQAGITSVSDPYLFAADGGMYSNGTTYKDRTAYLNYLGRVNYKYADKYYLDVTVLRQGTSIFNPNGYQYGTFPSVAAAWRISSENFFKNLPFDDFKIKAGIGQLGNSDTQAFQYLSLVQNQFAAYLVNGSPVVGAFLSNYPSTALTWEHIKTYNIGFEGSFKHSLTFSAEYYNRQTSGILQSYALPASSGLSINPYKNIGAATNKGVEVTANYQNHIGEFNYNVGFNITTTSNKVTQLDNNHPVSTPGGFVVVGDPIGSIYGYKSAGVIKTNAQLTAYQTAYAGSPYVSDLKLGDLMYQDLGGAPTKEDIAAGRQYHAGPDGKIDNYDGLVKLGKTIPGYFYGINLGSSYKQFDISLLFSGVGDVQKYNTIKYDGTTFGLPNQLTSVLDHWTAQNPNSNNPRAIAYGSSSANNNLVSDRFVESAAYLRLSNVQLGYTIPNKVFDKGKIFSRMRLFVTGSNLFIVTKYSGFDPENDLIPPARTLVAGINMTF